MVPKVVGSSPISHPNQARISGLFHWPMRPWFSLLQWYFGARTAFDLHSPLLYSLCREVVENPLRFRTGPSLLGGGHSRQRQTDIVFRVAKWWQPTGIWDLKGDPAWVAAGLAGAGPACQVISHGPIWTEAGPGQSIAPRIMILLPQPDQWASRGTSLDEILKTMPPPFMALTDLRGQRSVIGRLVAQKLSRPGAWIDLYDTGIWMRDESFLEPVQTGMIHRNWKPLRCGWV